MSLSSEAVLKVQSALDEVTSNKESGVPGMVFIAIDKKGETLVSRVSGQHGADTPRPVTLDSVFWIASCTKLITAVACLQLVEAGKIDLDDHAALYKYVPELDKMKMVSLEPDGFITKKLVDRPGDITLRMLLSHTAGFTYSFLDPRTKVYTQPVGLNEFSGDPRDILETPLFNPPGAAWEYGTSLDWAGLMVERITGMKLNDYFIEHIFNPLGLSNITMFPGPEMRANLMNMHQRWPTGNSNPVERDHLQLCVLKDLNADQKAAIFNSGGGGCFATPSDYIQILAAVLNDGTHPTSSARILSPASVDLLFENQIPDKPNFARNPLPGAKADLAQASSELYPQEGNPPQGWSFAGFFTGPEHPNGGRGANSSFWGGLPNLFWWVDRTKGVAGMISSQILPFGDVQVFTAWAKCEAAVYGGLSG